MFFLLFSFCLGVAADEGNSDVFAAEEITPPVAGK